MTRKRRKRRRKNKKVQRKQKAGHSAKRELPSWCTQGVPLVQRYVSGQHEGIQRISSVRKNNNNT
jgi:hypothetical protein